MELFSDSAGKEVDVKAKDVPLSILGRGSY